MLYAAIRERKTLQSPYIVFPVILREDNYGYLQEDAIRPHMRVCSRHFRGGDATSAPNLALGKYYHQAREFQTSLTCPLNPIVKMAAGWPPGTLDVTSRSIKYFRS